MADGNFRPYRRDPAAPRSADAAARGRLDDPLAELARLIGQGEPVHDGGRDPYDRREGGLDWAAGGPYAEEAEPAEPNYDARYDERYEPAPPAEPYPAYRTAPSPQGGDYGVEAGDQYSAPEPRFDALRDGSRGYAVEPARNRDLPEPSEAMDRQLPAFLPRREERYRYDEAQDGSDDRDYALEDYQEDAPSPRRRGGLVVVAAVLGLAVLGTAGAFAYRAMFGASMLPSLPPIIKADDGPNKIVPSNSKLNALAQSDATSSSSGEKLVSREEQPVAMPAPVNPAPRVVSTIPIFPDPNSAQAGSVAAGASASSAPVAAPPAVPPVAAPPSTTPAATVPPAGTVSVPAAAAAPQAPQAVSTEPKKIRTVAIRPDQMGGSEEATPASPAASASPPPPPPAPVRTGTPRAAPPPAPRPAPQAEANAPLSIVPDQGGAAPAPARTRTALAQPMPLSTASPTAPAPAPAAGGGYAVQVTSQRSEAEAQTEFRALRAKFPSQLGGREPIVRRADLGAKGVFYRAMVGPFASMEQAAEMCSSLKAAGGNCIVQRD